MSDDYWWKEAKIYELYVDKFAGDFRGLTERLGYLSELGMNCLHILPHYPSPLVDDGYDVSDYRAVRKELGTLKDFEMFTRAAHARGIRVIIDFVLNHVSAEHPWFIEARASRESSFRDFFLWSDTAREHPLAPNPFPDIKSVNWIPNPATQDFYFATFYPQQPDLNWDNPDVEEAMLAHMDFWIDLGVDGFRLDAAAHLIKREGTSYKGLPETHAVLKRIRKHIEQKNAGIVLLAEVHQQIPETKRYFGVGDECHMIYHFPLAEQLLLSLLSEDLTKVGRMINESFDIPNNCQWAVFLRNHDDISDLTLTPSERRILVDALDPGHRYPFKKGSTIAVRLATALRGDKEMLRKAFELLYSIPGAPVMYYGDEIGMENLPPQKGIADSRKYVRGKFDWGVARQAMADPGSLFHEVALLARGKVEGEAMPERKVLEAGVLGR